MQELLHNSLGVYSQLRDTFQTLIEKTRTSDKHYAWFAGRQMHYYSSRCQSANLLLQHWELWDSEIIMRSALECATRFLFVSIASPEERSTRITECTKLLNEIEDIQRSEKAKTAAKNSSDPDENTIFRGATLSPERESELRKKWPKAKRQSLNQKWSFSEMVRALEKFKEPTLDLSLYGSLLHSYGLSSHLIHGDETALTLIFDRQTRTPDIRLLQEKAHFARLATQQTSLFFLCLRAMEHASGIRLITSELATELLELQAASNIYHQEFFESQRNMYEASPID